MCFNRIVERVAKIQKIRQVVKERARHRNPKILYFSGVVCCVQHNAAVVGPMSLSIASLTARAHRAIGLCLTKQLSLLNSVQQVHNPAARPAGGRAVCAFGRWSCSILQIHPYHPSPRSQWGSKRARAVRFDRIGRKLIFDFIICSPEYTTEFTTRVLFSDIYNPGMIACISLPGHPSVRSGMISGSSKAPIPPATINARLPTPTHRP